MVLDACPKLLQLPRSDSALCFAGDTAATYPLMMQLANAIAAHGPARDRSLDISTLKAHMLRVFTDIILSVKDASVPFTTGDGQFIFGGYSWKSRAFRLWTIYWAPKKKRFEARESLSFHPSLNKIAFIGDRAKDLRGRLVLDLKMLQEGHKVFLEPMRTLARMLEAATIADSIGGPPQVIRVTPHMNTRPLCVLWGSEKVPTLFGRELFDYEKSRLLDD